MILDSFACFQPEQVFQLTDKGNGSPCLGFLGSFTSPVPLFARLLGEAVIFSFQRLVLVGLLEGMQSLIRRIRFSI